MQTITFPPFLKPGDGIAIISSARKIEKEVVSLAESFITSKGFDIFLGPNLFSEHYQFAGNDAQRASDFNWALKHPKVKAIFFARGGYGSVRLLDKIDWDYFKKKPKWLVGYSDITVFHSVCNHLNIASIHATMPINYENNTTESTDDLFQLLKGIPNTLPASYTGPEIKAPLVGGNLSILYSLSGTPYQLNTENKLLFVEDLDEYLYHIDRMLQNLKFSGQLNKKTKGLILGGLSDMNDNSVPFGYSAEESGEMIANELKISLAKNLVAGHQKENRPLCLGAIYQLTKNKLCLIDPYFSQIE